MKVYKRSTPDDDDDEDRAPLERFPGEVKLYNFLKRTTEFNVKGRALCALSSKDGRKVGATLKRRVRAE